MSSEPGNITLEEIGALKIMELKENQNVQTSVLTSEILATFLVTH